MKNSVRLLGDHTSLRHAAFVLITVVGAFLGAASGLSLSASVANADLGPQGADLNFNTYPEKSKTVDIRRETEPRRAQNSKKVTRKKKKAASEMHEALTPETTPPAFAAPAETEAVPSSRGEVVARTPSTPDPHLGIPELEVGLSLQPFQAGGRVGLKGMQPYDVGATVGLQPMGALDFSWLPWQFDVGQPLALGIFASLGYSRSAVNLSSPQGGALTGTELQSLKAQGGATLAWQPSLASIYRLRLQAGGGQWNEIQTSDAAIANESAFEYFGSLGVYGDIHFMPRSAPDLAAYLGYDYRMPLTAEPQEITLQRQNFVAGLAGTFQ